MRGQAVVPTGGDEGRGTGGRGRPHYVSRRMVSYVGIVLCLLLGMLPGGAVHGAGAGSRVLRLGVNMHPLQDNYATYSPVRTLELASEVGTSVVRVDIHWEWFEYLGPGSGPWDASQLQELVAFVDEAARRHIRVLATVHDTPCWASSEPGRICPPAKPHYHPSYPPRNPQDYANFLKRVIAHVRNKIQYYEIWNEPNISRFWAHPNPAVYTRLLKAAYRAIKSRAPSAQVLAGAMSRADVHFLNGMYAAGAKGHFDALSVHPYSDERPPDDCSTPERSFACGVERIRRAMLDRGDSRPIWLTEFGVQTSEGVSVAAQADYVTRALSLIKGWSYVQGALWYELYDDPTGHDRERYGLFGQDLSPKPAATVFASSARAEQVGRRRFGAQRIVR